MFTDKKTEICVCITSGDGGQGRVGVGTAQFVWSGINGGLLDAVFSLLCDE